MERLRIEDEQRQKRIAEDDARRAKIAEEDRLHKERMLKEEEERR